MTKTQEKQINYLNSVEYRERNWRGFSFSCECKTCGESKQMNSVEGARCFVMNHAGHYTWISTIR